MNTNQIQRTVAKILIQRNNGHPVEVAAKKAGISRALYYDYRKRLAREGALNEVIENPSGFIGEVSPTSTRTETGTAEERSQDQEPLTPATTATLTTGNTLIALAGEPTQVIQALTQLASRRFFG